MHGELAQPLFGLAKVWPWLCGRWPDINAEANSANSYVSCRIKTLIACTDNKPTF